MLVRWNKLVPVHILIFIKGKNIIFDMFKFIRYIEINVFILHLEVLVAGQHDNVDWQ